MEKHAFKFKLILLLFASLQVRLNAQTTLDFSADVKARKSLPFVMYSKPCNPPMESLFGNDKILSLYASSKLISGSMFCRDLHKEVKTSYTKDYCRKVAVCVESKPSFAEFKNTDGPHLLREFVTNEYVSSEISRNIADMEMFESMVKFAKIKYGKKFGNLCPSKFQDDLNDSLCTKRINSVFSQSQKNCNLVSAGCYSHNRYGVTSYTKMAEKNSADLNTFSQYFSELTDVIAKNADENEKTVTSKLMSILSSDESHARKTEQFYKAVYDLEMERKLDPVLSYYPGNKQLSLKIEIEKRFGNFLSENLKIRQPIEQLTKKFEDFKLDLSKKFVETTCLHTPSYESLCENSVNIFHGKKKARVDLGTAQKQLNEEMLGLVEEKIEQLNLKIDSDEITPNGFRDSQLLLEHERCESYDFHVDNMMSERTTLSKKLMEMPDYSQFVMSSRIVDDLITANADTKTRIALARKNSTVSNFSQSSKEEDKKIPSENLSPKMLAKLPDIPMQAKNENTIKPAVETKPRNTNEAQELKAQIQKGQTVDFGLPEINQNSITGKKLNDYHSEGANKEITSALDHNDEKLRQLNKKLLETNNKVAGEEKRFKEKSKIDGPSQGNDELMAISKDLASLKESLFESSQKNEKIKITTTLSEKIPLDSRSASEEDENESERQNISSATSNAPSGGSNYSAPQTSSSTSVSTTGPVSAPSGKNASSGVINNSEINTNTTSSAISPVRLVLSAQDGTTNEQKEAAILSNILELEGQSFDIIEDGERVKILPLLEKGKLILNDGKPRFIRIKRNIKTTTEPQSRAISSAGELKKNQEDSLKAEDERLRYIKMKKLSEDLIRKTEKTMLKGK